MICEILHQIFDALDDELRFHGLGCGGKCEAVGKTRWQIGNAQNLRRINQRKGTFYLPDLIIGITNGES